MEEKRILIAEGDSWFRFGPWGFDIVNALEELRYEVRSVAYQGDSLEEMVGQFQDPGGLEENLGRISNEKKQLSAILLSAGGNDLAGKKKTVWGNVYKLECLLNKNANDNSQTILNKDKVTEVIDGKLYRLYKKLILKIDQACGKLNFVKPVPTLIHGYGYVVPDGRRTGSGGVGNAMPGLPGGDIGPWLKPAFDNKGYKNRGFESKSEKDLQSLRKNTAVMEALIDSFNKMIKERLTKLPVEHVEVKHVDLRRCISNSLNGMPGFRNYRKDWQDEMHPTVPGFEKIARKFDKVLTS